jgi:membrane-associated phospholipid phosphatase
MSALENNIARKLAPIAVTRPWLALFLSLAGWFAILSIFKSWPSLDLEAARYFFNASPCLPEQSAGATCGSFALSSTKALIALRMVLYYLPHALAILLLALVIGEQRRGQPDRAFIRKGWILLAGVIAGPVILVNGLLKPFSGRPRPYEILDFAGKLDFVAVGDFSGACARNCSFISGEAAGAGWVFCLVVLLPAPIRRAMVLPLLAVTLFATFLRVMFGGHFLSDALLGWLSSIVVCLVAAVIIGWPKPLRN